jgi:hypothetical protein
VVIINLDRRPDRWNTIMKELVSKGFPENIIYRESAVDGKDNHRAAIRALYDSNMNIWKKHLNGVYPTEWLLILEDDAELWPGYDYERVIREFSEYVSKNKDVNIMRSNPGSCPINNWGTEAVFTNKAGSKLQLDLTSDHLKRKRVTIPYDHFFRKKSKQIPHKCVGTNKGGMFKQVGRNGTRFITLRDSNISR